jgi:hypothetical protein
VLGERFDRVGIPRYSVRFKTFMPQARFVMFRNPENRDSAYFLWKEING